VKLIQSYLNKIMDAKQTIPVIARVAPPLLVGVVIYYGLKWLFFTNDEKKKQENAPRRIPAKFCSSACHNSPSFHSCYAKHFRASTGFTRSDSKNSIAKAVVEKKTDNFARRFRTHFSARSMFAVSGRCRGRIAKSRLLQGSSLRSIIAGWNNFMAKLKNKEGRKPLHLVLLAC
jgi:hypothetical protein